MSERFKTLKSLMDEMDDLEPPQGFLPWIPGSPQEGILPANTCNHSTLPPDAKKAHLDLLAAQEKLKDTLAGEMFEGLGLALEDEGGPGPSQNAPEEEEDDLYN
ncbi:hypothetical protein FRC11_010483 [Ceratobasidium sp. 423]|nr:hypothetical protein FRC11_010483 [Ceratobasidium sp. 423]